MIVVSNLLKVIAAFVAGVVVALGGALLYVHTDDLLHTRPAAHPVAAPAPTNDRLAQSDPVPQPIEQPTADLKPASVSRRIPEPAQQQQTAPPAIAPAKSTHAQPAARLSRTSATVPFVPRPKPQTEPVMIAQNRPQSSMPSMPAQTSTPAPDSAPQPSASQDSSPSNLAQPPPVSEQAYQPSQPARPAPHTVTLSSGTPLIVRLGETLSTDRNYTGDTFRGTLASPIIIDGFIIADKGSRVLGRIVNAQKAGRNEGSADLNLTLTQINTTDGQRVLVQTNSNDRQGPYYSGHDAAKIAGGAALGAIIGAVAGGGKGAAIGAGAGGAAGTGLALSSHGKPCVIPVESQLTFQLAVPVTLTEKLN